MNILLWNGSVLVLGYFIYFPKILYVSKNTGHYALKINSGHDTFSAAFSNFCSTLRYDKQNLHIKARNMLSSRALPFTHRAPQFNPQHHYIQRLLFQFMSSFWPYMTIIPISERQNMRKRDVAAELDFSPRVLAQVPSDKH